MTYREHDRDRWALSERERDRERERERDRERDRDRERGRERDAPPSPPGPGPAPQPPPPQLAHSHSGLSLSYGMSLSQSQSPSLSQSLGSLTSSVGWQPMLTPPLPSPSTAPSAPLQTRERVGAVLARTMARCVARSEPDVVARVLREMAVEEQRAQQHCELQREQAKLEKSEDLIDFELKVHSSPSPSVCVAHSGVRVEGAVQAGAGRATLRGAVCRCGRGRSRDEGTGARWPHPRYAVDARQGRLSHTQHDCPLTCCHCPPLPSECKL